MKVRCLDVRYEEGEYELVQGIKDYQTSHSLPGGSRFNARGYGWGEITTSSRLLLIADDGNEDDDSEKEIRIDFFFKKELGKLTEKMRRLIRATMSESVNVERRTGEHSEYWAVTEEDLESWLARIKATKEFQTSYKAKQRRIARELEKLKKGSTDGEDSGKK